MGSATVKGAIIMQTKELSGGMKVLAAIFAVLTVIIGIFLLIFPGLIVWMFSAAVFIYGIQLIIRYITMKDMRSGWDIISGIINILFGAIMLFGSAETMIMGIITIEIFIAVWVLFAGISHLFGSFELKKLGAKKWGWTLAGGILMIICGIAFLCMPAASAVGLIFTIGIFTGVSFIIGGITELVKALSGKNYN
jgi:uncharacterized membrane protein HdeD (DUF308 family)